MTLQIPWSRPRIQIPTLNVTPAMTLTPTATLIPNSTLILTPTKSALQAVASESAVPIRCVSSHVDNVRKAKRAILMASA